MEAIQGKTETTVKVRQEQMRTKMEASQEEIKVTLRGSRWKPSFGIV
jgi:hypothetical protein